LRRGGRSPFIGNSVKRSRPFVRKGLRLITNRTFAEWSQVFPNAACVVSVIERLIQHAAIAPLDVEPHRTQEASKCAKTRAKQKKARKS
jgi:hypothetical protein